MSLANKNHLRRLAIGILKETWAETITSYFRCGWVKYGMPGNKKGNKQYGRNAAKDKSTDSKKNKKKGMARRKKAVI